MAFLRATQPVTQSSTARNFEREFKVAIRGAVVSTARYNSVCEEVEQWQAYTNELICCRGRIGLLHGGWNAGLSCRGRSF